ncbi:riboflavin synthase subunit alpha [Candidatus Nomurabacteria bacterium RIFCSPLOWO2_01_FULL_42_17]|uniref:Riboflavin synthase n=1 Tax=Candidatus Nomurabacteria bacterium RIFCSPLOWO2_01_FULL_42_17 TaxID=1801780 RepID=A0A1F6XLQ7_9BACT|nr:MAG: riboflavin synthase subunit alpha [Candidatus Nomurabacteria bacterium RIFCSPLOWO2_01_FULL_42_17]
MFTGIISKTSKINEVKSAKDGLFVKIANNLGKIKLGESISVNGVCSTVKKFTPSKGGGGKNIYFEYMPETLKITNLSFLKKNDTVNIERSMRLGDRISGHIVLGHIDGKGEILNIKKEGNSQAFEIKIPAKSFKKFLVYKGSVTMEGISLTVVKVSSNSFIVKIIPYTLKHTNLKFKKKGDFLNLEFDILIKYANKK